MRGWWRRRPPRTLGWQAGHGDGDAQREGGFGSGEGCSGGEGEEAQGEAWGRDET